MGSLGEEVSAFADALAGPLSYRRSLRTLISPKSRFKEAVFSLKV